MTRLPFVSCPHGFESIEPATSQFLSLDIKVRLTLGLEPDFTLSYRITIANAQGCY